jgi:parallel beta-helix repeat protein
MKKIQSRITISILLIIGLAIMPVLTNIGLGNFNNNVPKIAAPHAPVNLDGNPNVDAYFGTNGSNGMTPNTAHMINMYDITSSLNGNGIRIVNSDRFVNITNCNFSLGGDWGLYECAIYLENVSNIAIDNCIVNSWGGNGIGMINATNIEITNSVVDNNPYHGIPIMNSSYVYIDSCNITNNWAHGILSEDVYILEVNYCNVSANWENGINSTNTNLTTLGYNEISQNWENGIGLDTCSMANIDKNVLDSNVGMGIYAFNNSQYIQINSTNLTLNMDTGIGLEADDSFIVDCQLGMNYGSGIEVAICDNITLDGNLVGLSGLHGILLNTVTDLTILDNNITQNGWGGTYDGINTTSDIDVANINLNEISFNSGNGISLSSGSDMNNLHWNDILNNTGYGMIFAGTSQMNSIRNNTICGNGDSGIKVEGSPNAIESNDICENGESGLFLSSTASTDVLYNNLTGNYENGITAVMCQDNIQFNNASLNFMNGIYLYDSDLGTINNNIANENGMNGIGLYQNSDNNNIHDNTANDNGEVGIHIGCTGNDIDGNIATGNYIGLNLSKYSNTSTVNDNDFSDCTTGIGIEGSDLNTLTNNVMDNCGIGIDTVLLADIDNNNIDTSNEVNGKPVYFYNGQTGLDESDFINAGQVILLNCDNSLIADVNASSVSAGIEIFFCQFIDITNVTANDNTQIGIYLYESDNTTITESEFNSNDGYGHTMVDCENTLIYLNEFSNNPAGQAFDFNGQNNAWDNGTLGNYWGDYSTRYPAGTPNGMVYSLDYEVGNPTSGVWDYNPLVFTPDMNVDPVFSVVPGVSTSYEQNQTGNDLSWTVTDGTIYSATWIALLNGSNGDSGTWTSGTPITFDLDDLEIGFYNITLVIDDGWDIVENYTILEITNGDPIANGPSTQAYIPTTTGNTITWTIDDISYNNSAVYTVYRNGTYNGSGVWTHNTPFAYNVDGLVEGDYNYTIVVTDGYGANDTATCILSVIPNVAPTITHPADTGYIAGATGNSLSWTVTDLTTSTPTYTILRNGSVDVTPTAWTTGTPINYVIDGLAPGNYNITIISLDGLGMNVSDEVIVTVTNTNPAITAPADVSYVVGATGNSINWTVTDANVNSPTYTIERNGTVVKTATAWATGVAIVFSIDGLAAGSYSIVIKIVDGYGGTVQDTVIVTVTAPTSTTTTTTTTTTATPTTNTTSSTSSSTTAGGESPVDGGIDGYNVPLTLGIMSIVAIFLVKSKKKRV